MSLIQTEGEMKLQKTEYGKFLFHYFCILNEVDNEPNTQSNHLQQAELSMTINGCYIEGRNLLLYYTVSCSVH